MVTLDALKTDLYQQLFETHPDIMLLIEGEYGGIMRANLAACQFYGHDAATLSHMSLHDIRVLPREEVQKEIRLAQTRERTHFKARHQLGSGDIREVEIYSSCLEAERGPVLCWIIRDVTEQKQMELALRESKELYYQLFEAESDAVVLIENTTGQILEANSAALLLYGYPREEFLSKKNTDMSAEPEETRMVTEKTPVIAEKVIHIPLRWHRKKDGSIFPVEITGRFFNWKGQNVHIAAIRDITKRRETEEKLLEQQKQLEAANARLEALAVKDPLTELYNRRAFNKHLTTEIARAVRHKIPLSLILIDIDHFKIYNDTFGHPAGDEILQQLAQILLTCSRGTDFPVRYGGEEFTIILPETGVEGAIQSAERLRTALEDAPWPGRSITASFGVTTLEPDTSPKTDLQLIMEADQALYHSKNTGRNRVTHIKQIAPG